MDPMQKADRRIFGTLFFSIFTVVTGVGIVVPLLPVYAHDLGASGMYIGLIFGAFSISRTLFLPYFGRRSDRSGRKPFIVLGLLGYGLVSIGFIVSTTVETLIAFRCLQGVASAMIMPVAQAYVGDLTPKNREGVTMGLFNAATFIGLSFGPLIGGYLSEHFTLRTAFLAMSGLSFASFLLSLACLPPVREERNSCRLVKKAVGWPQLMRDREITGLFIFRMVYTACISTIWGFLPLFADIAFALTSSEIGVVVTLGIFTSGMLQTPMGWVADRLNKRMMIVTGGLLVSVAFFGFELAESFAHLLAANFLFGVGGSILMAPLMAISVQKGNRTRAMGAVMALMTMSHSVGMAAGAILAGSLMDAIPLRGIFAFGYVMMLFGTTAFILCTVRTGSTARKALPDTERDDSRKMDTAHPMVEMGKSD